MSKATAKKKKTQEPSKPTFSRLRCLCFPQSAADPEHSVPFAVLQINVKKGRALLPADIDGMSDPYVKFEVNGKDTGKKTKAIQKTLAPQWDESFDIDIFRPSSVLTLCLYDADFGSSLDVGVAGQLFGLDDDFIGYLDVQIARLPQNEAVSAWFNILSPDTYVDSLKGRLLQEAQRKSHEPAAGQINLEMTLKVQQPFDEFFAFCIGPPPLGMHLAPLDLPALFADGLHLTEHADAWELRVEALGKDALAQSTFLWSSAIFICWFPQFILPALLIAIGLFVVFQHRWEPHFHPKGVGNQEQVKAAVEAAAKAGETGGTPDVAEGESLIDPALLKTLGSVQGLVSAEDAANLRLAFRNIHVGLFLIRAFEKAMHNNKQATLVFILLGGLSALLVVFRNWQAIVIQVSLTCVCAVMLIQQSCVTRIVVAFIQYQVHKRQLRIHTLTPKKRKASGLKKSDSRSLSRMETMHLQTLSHSNQHKKKDAGGTQKHQFSNVTFTSLTWCDDCGKFMWGVWQQGYSCSICHRNVCALCHQEEQTHEECPGIPIKRIGCCLAPCRATCCPGAVRAYAGAETSGRAGGKEGFPEPSYKR